MFKLTHKHKLEMEFLPELQRMKFIFTYRKQENVIEVDFGYTTYQIETLIHILQFLSQEEQDGIEISAEEILYISHANDHTFKSRLETFLQERKPSFYEKLVIIKDKKYAKHEFLTYEDYVCESGNHYFYYRSTLLNTISFCVLYKNKQFHTFYMKGFTRHGRLEIFLLYDQNVAGFSKHGDILLKSVGLQNEMKWFLYGDPTIRMKRLFL
ncbi:MULTISPECIES: hypothetical protein [Bacillus cereus group]|uniref:hypothetical protein n=1 Tax=Bacillus cereus group TaxID=86661 RepID=UPI00101472E4|nr:MULTISPECIES: hypothetical protein [Bacillus cereus group]MCU5201660.1 hypothetical protein [Bacillus paranthracis]MCU5374688.1 hypothetical protein [Bacillus pacificus]GCF76366.1 hypothetical protein BC2926_39070 [Bacillus cereus]